MVGAIPDRLRLEGRRRFRSRPISRWRAARKARMSGLRSCPRPRHAHGVPALEMTKWFDTNYHYMVPELAPGQTLPLSVTQADRGIRGSAARWAIQTRPVLLGPVTFLSLAKSRDADDFDPLSLLDALLPVYVEVLQRARRERAPTGCRSTSPAWSLDLERRPQRRALQPRLRALAEAVPALKIMLTTYFGGLRRQSRYRAGAAGGRPASSTWCAAPEQLDEVLRPPPEGSGALARRHRRPQHLARRPDAHARPARARSSPARERPRVDRAVLLAAAVPIDLATETDLDPRAAELARLRRAEARGAGRRSARRSNEGRGSGRGRAWRSSARAAAAPQGLAANSSIAGARPHRRARRPTMRRRASAFAERAAAQQAAPATCPLSRPPRSAPFRRPPRSAHARADARAGAHRPTTPIRAVPGEEDRARRSAGRRRSASTCWCTASSNATTWCSISASSLSGFAFTATAGCRSTARAACGRRSSSATSRGPSPMTVAWCALRAVADEASR